MDAESRIPLFTMFPPIPTEAWLHRIEADLKGASLDTLTWKNDDGLSVLPFYRAESMDTLSHRPPVYARVEPVSIRQDLGLADISKANQLAHEAVAGGVNALGLRTRVNQVNQYGLPLFDPEQMKGMLKNLPLESLAIHIDAGLASPTILSLFLKEAHRSGYTDDVLTGSLSFDPMAESLRGEKVDINAAFDRLALLLEDRNVPPRMKMVTVDMRPYHEAGGTATQELIGALGALTETMAALTTREVDPNKIATNVQLLVAVGSHFFLEIAKLRALRLLVGQVFSAFGISHQPHIQAMTSLRRHTLYDRYVNGLRATTQATSALIGGCDTLAVRPISLFSPDPSPAGTRLARNTIHILQKEAQVHAVSDPAAGAYYIEVLTDQLAKQTWEAFQEIEASGGFLAALQRGDLQSAIAATAIRRANAFAKQERVVLGTNQFPNPEETLAFSPTSTPAYADMERSQAASLPSVLLRGTYQELLIPDDVEAIQPLSFKRDAEPFETLRLHTEAFVRSKGSPPTVLLLPFGNPRWRTARAAFARNFFGCAGFNIDEAAPLDLTELALDEALGHHPDLLVLCSADDSYPELVSTVAHALKAAPHPPLLLIAGNPDQLPADEFRSQGVDGFIHKGTPLLETLQQYQHELGIGDL